MQAWHGPGVRTWSCYHFTSLGNSPPSVSNIATWLNTSVWTHRYHWTEGLIVAVLQTVMVRIIVYGQETSSWYYVCFQRRSPWVCICVCSVYVCSLLCIIYQAVYGVYNDSQWQIALLQYVLELYHIQYTKCQALISANNKLATIICFTESRKQYNLPAFIGKRWDTAHFFML